MAALCLPHCILGCAEMNRCEVSVGRCKRVGLVQHCACTSPRAATCIDVNRQDVTKSPCTDARFECIADNVSNANFRREELGTPLDGVAFMAARLGRISCHKATFNMENIPVNRSCVEQLTMREVFAAGLETEALVPALCEGPPRDIRGLLT
jgi:hypothetical protein